MSARFEGECRERAFLWFGRLYTAAVLQAREQIRPVLDLSAGCKMYGQNTKVVVGQLTAHVAHAPGQFSFTFGYEAIYYQLAHRCFLANQRLRCLPGKTNSRLH